MKFDFVEDDLDEIVHVSYFCMPVRSTNAAILLVRMPRIIPLCAVFVFRVNSHAPSIRSHRGTQVFFPDFQPMRVSEKLVCIDHFRQNPVFTSMHLKAPVHVVPPQENHLSAEMQSVNTTCCFLLCRLFIFISTCSCPLVFLQPSPSVRERHLLKKLQSPYDLQA